MFQRKWGCDDSCSCGPSAKFCRNRIGHPGAQVSYVSTQDSPKAIYLYCSSHCRNRCISSMSNITLVRNIWTKLNMLNMLHGTKWKPDSWLPGHASAKHFESEVAVQHQPVLSKTFNNKIRWRLPMTPNDCRECASHMKGSLALNYLLRLGWEWPNYIESFSVDRRIKNNYYIIIHRILHPGT